MAWFIFALLSAFFDSTYYALVKRFLKNMHQHVLAGGVFLCTSLLLFLISAIRGFPEIGPQLYSSVAVTVVINIVAIILVFKAFQETDLSLAVPLTAFTPVFLLLTSFLFLSEVPGFWGVMGILLIVIGAFVLYYNRNHHTPWSWLREMFRTKGTRYMLLVAFLFSISTNFDKLVVLNSDAFFGSAIVFFFLGAAFILLSLAVVPQAARSYKKNVLSFFLLGMVVALAVVFFNLALQEQLVSYTLSLKRLSILFSVFYGGLFFREKQMPQRIAGAVLMVLGLVLIVVL